MIRVEDIDLKSPLPYFWENHKRQTFVLYFLKLLCYDNGSKFLLSFFGGGFGARKTIQTSFRIQANW